MERAEKLRYEARTPTWGGDGSKSLIAALHVLADLSEQGWEIDPGGPTVRYPDTSDDPPTALRDRQRRTMQISRNRHLQRPEVRDFLRRMEAPRSIGGRFVSVLSLIDNGCELAERLDSLIHLPDAEQQVEALQDLIAPVVEVCDATSTCEHTGLLLNDIWRYFRLTWSLEYRPTPGRSLPVLVRNAARPNSPVMGIALLASAPSALRVRDDWIGWTVESLRTRLSAAGTATSDAGRIGSTLIDALDHSIADIRQDDLLPDNLRNCWNNDVMIHLRQIADLATEHRYRQLDAGNNARALPLNSDGEIAWREASEQPLFVRKRALLLLQLLRARHAFVQHGMTCEHETLPSLFETEDGRSAIGTALKELRKRALASHIIDVSVCGAISPYNELLAGKLVALLLASQEVCEAYVQRYQEQTSLIASQMAGRPVVRQVDPLLLTTTSLYGVRPNQYQRLNLSQSVFQNLPMDLRWREIGLTKGFGTIHFSQETVEALRDLMLEKRGGVRWVNNVFGEGSSPRLRQVREGLDALGFDSDILLLHGVRRLIYVCETVTDARDRLLFSTQPTIEVNRPHVASIADAWRRRWLIRRVNRPDIIDRIATLGPQTIQNELAAGKAIQLSLPFSDHLGDVAASWSWGTPPVKS